MQCSKFSTVGSGGDISREGGASGSNLTRPFDSLSCWMDPRGLVGRVKGVAKPTIVGKSVGLFVTFHIHVGRDLYPQYILKSGI